MGENGSTAEDEAAYDDEALAVVKELEGQFKIVACAVEFVGYSREAEGTLKSAAGAVELVEYGSEVRAPFESVVEAKIYVQVSANREVNATELTTAGRCPQDSVREVPRTELSRLSSGTAETVGRTIVRMKSSRLTAPEERGIFKESTEVNTSQRRVQ